MNLFLWFIWFITIIKSTPGIFCTSWVVCPILPDTFLHFYFASYKVRYLLLSSPFFHSFINIFLVSSMCEAPLWRPEKEQREGPVFPETCLPVERRGRANKWTSKSQKWWKWGGLNSMLRIKKCDGLQDVWKSLLHNQIWMTRVD